MTYKFRHFFDAGSGICLWSADEHTKKKFDYPVEHSKLSITDNLRRRLVYLCSWYDTSIDWDNPADSSLWSQAEQEQFQIKSDKLLDELRQELGKDFKIID